DCRRRLVPGRQRKGVGQIVEVALPGCHLAGRPEPLQRASTRDGGQDSDRPTSVGDLDRLPAGDEAQQLTGPLPQLPHTDAPHVLFVAQRWRCPPTPCVSIPLNALVNAPHRRRGARRPAGHEQLVVAGDVRGSSWRSAPGRNRTLSLTVRSRLLYPLSYGGESRHLMNPPRLHVARSYPAGVTVSGGALGSGRAAPRSEERRVGKECRSQWVAYYEKK